MTIAGPDLALGTEAPNAIQPGRNRPLWPIQPGLEDAPCNGVIR